MADKPDKVAGPPLLAGLARKRRFSEVAEEDAAASKRLTGSASMIPGSDDELDSEHDSEGHAAPPGDAAAVVSDPTVSSGRLTGFSTSSASPFASSRWLGKAPFKEQQLAFRGPSPKRQRLT